MLETAFLQKILELKISELEITGTSHKLTTINLIGLDYILDTVILN